MNMKKIAILALSLCMIAAIAVTGTIAYFADADSATNVFTVGNVDIVLYESTLHRENAGVMTDGGKGDLVNEKAPTTAADSEYKTNEKAYTDEEIIADAKNYKDYLEAESEDMLSPGEHIKKMPYVKNTGKLPAYVRIRVMIPAALDTEILNASYMCTSATKSGEFTMEYNNTEGKTVDKVKYNVYEFTRVEPLAAGEMTYWNVWGSIAMDTDVTNDQINALTTAGAIVDGKFNVLVEADAIQAADFATAAEAFAAFNGAN